MQIKLFPCERRPDTAKFTVNHCVSRQIILEKGKTRNGWSNSQNRDCEFCRGCETGLRFYQESLKSVLKHKPGKNYHFKKQEKIIMATKKCTKCNKEFPLTREYFYKQKQSPDGFHTWCKDCHNKSCGKGTAKKPMKESDQKQLNEKRHKELVSLEKEKVKEPIEKIIKLDFSKYPELFEKVELWAQNNLRTINNQIVFHLMHDTSIKNIKRV